MGASQKLGYHLGVPITGIILLRPAGICCLSKHGNYHIGTDTVCWATILYIVITRDRGN